MCSLKARLTTLGQAGYTRTKLQFHPSLTAKFTCSLAVEASNSFVPAQDAANLLHKHCNIGVAVTLADTPWCSNTHPKLHAH